MSSSTNDSFSFAHQRRPTIRYGKRSKQHQQHSATTAAAAPAQKHQHQHQQQRIGETKKRRGIVEEAEEEDENSSNEDSNDDDDNRRMNKPSKVNKQIKPSRAIKRRRIKVSPLLSPSSSPPTASAAPRTGTNPTATSSLHLIDHRSRSRSPSLLRSSTAALPGQVPPLPLAPSAATIRRPRVRLARVQSQVPTISITNSSLVLLDAPIIPPSHSAPVSVSAATATAEVRVGAGGEEVAARPHSRRASTIRREYENENERLEDRSSSSQYVGSAIGDASRALSTITGVARGGRQVGSTKGGVGARAREEGRAGLQVPTKTMRRKDVNALPLSIPAVVRAAPVLLPSPSLLPSLAPSLSSSPPPPPPPPPSTMTSWSQHSVSEQQQLLSRAPWNTAMETNPNTNPLLVDSLRSFVQSQRLPHQQQASVHRPRSQHISSHQQHLHHQHHQHQQPPSSSSLVLPSSAVVDLATEPPTSLIVGRPTAASVAPSVSVTSYNFSSIDQTREQAQDERRSHSHSSDQSQDCCQPSPFPPTSHPDSHFPKQAVPAAAASSSVVDLPLSRIRDANVRFPLDPPRSQDRRANTSTIPARSRSRSPQKSPQKRVGTAGGGQRPSFDVFRDQLPSTMLAPVLAAASAPDAIDLVDHTAVSMVDSAPPPSVVVAALLLPRPLSTDIAMINRNPAPSPHLRPVTIPSLDRHIGQPPAHPLLPSPSMVDAESTVAVRPSSSVPLSPSPPIDSPLNHQHQQVSKSTPRASRVQSVSDREGTREEDRVASEETDSQEPHPHTSEAGEPIQRKMLTRWRANADDGVERAGQDGGFGMDSSFVLETYFDYAFDEELELDANLSRNGRDAGDEKMNDRTVSVEAVEDQVGKRKAARRDIAQSAAMTIELGKIHCSLIDIEDASDVVDSAVHHRHHYQQRQQQNRDSSFIVPRQPTFPTLLSSSPPAPAARTSTNLQPAVVSAVVAAVDLSSSMRGVSTSPSPRSSKMRKDENEKDEEKDEYNDDAGDAMEDDQDEVDDEEGEESEELAFAVRTRCALDDSSAKDQDGDEDRASPTPSSLLYGCVDDGDDEDATILWVQRSMRKQVRFSGASSHSSAGGGGDVVAATKMMVKRKRIILKKALVCDEDGSSDELMM